LERDGVNGGALSAILLASGAAGFTGNLAGARLSERDVRGSVLAMAALLGLSILLLDVLGRNAIIAVVLVMAWGFAFGMLPISMQSWMYDAAPGHLEGIQALFVSVAQLAIGGGALIGGAIVDHVGIDAALLAGSAEAIPTVLIIIVSRVERARRHVREDGNVPAHHDPSLDGSNG
jgi:predicted MFS family arabinose efflux permease